MNPSHVAIVGFIGPLAGAAAEALRRLGHRVSVVGAPGQIQDLGSDEPSRILCFPFSPVPSRRVLRQQETDLAYLKALLQWARRPQVVRIVLRSHAIAYGVSMKNPGLMEEGRVTLLPKASFERRWLEAEEMLFSSFADAGEPGPVPAAVRLTSILDPGEGDLVAAMLIASVAAPMAGYDPQMQFLSLADAAGCLAGALLSDSPGIFNAASAGTVPIRAALKAAVPVRIPVNGVLQKPLRSLLWKAGWSRFPGEAMDRLKYNWTVSGERARQELGFEPHDTGPAAVRRYLESRGRGRPERIRDEYDEFGLDPEYLRRMSWWFHFLSRVYWRAEVEGMENVPASEPALLVANHRGFMPFDGVVHRALILAAKNRHIRILVIPSLFKFPFLSDFLVKQGGVVASQVNTRKLFERRELVGIFPEGINGAFRMYRGAYRLGDMSRNAFARMAIANSVPLIPSATIGHVEIFPILGKIRSSWIVRHAGWPFLPITPTFPFLPVPLPTKWHIRYLEPIPVAGYAPSDANNAEAVRELAHKVRTVMQQNIDDMLRRRKHIFFGNIFDRRQRGSAQDTGRARRS